MLFQPIHHVGTTFFFFFLGSIYLKWEKRIHHERVHYSWWSHGRRSNKMPNWWVRNGYFLFKKSHLNDKAKTMMEKAHATQQIQAKFWWTRRKLAMIHTPIAAKSAPIFSSKRAVLGKEIWSKTAANERAKLIKIAAAKRSIKSGGEEVGELMYKAKLLEN